MGKAKTFVRYSLSGFYELHKKANKGKRMWSIAKSALQETLSTSRIGYVQREELTETCKIDGVGVAELADRFIFFNPDDIEGLVFDMSEHAPKLREWTNRYDRLKKGEADREWSEQFEN